MKANCHTCAHGRGDSARLCHLMRDGLRPKATEKWKVANADNLGKPCAMTADGCPTWAEPCAAGYTFSDSTTVWCCLVAPHAGLHCTADGVNFS